MSEPDVDRYGETAYAGLDAAVDDARWAFGAAFTDPLAGMDTTVPAQLDAQALAELCLALADDALVFSQRLQGWLTRLPELEAETAVANIGLDLLGQARLLLARAAAAWGDGRTEDDLAFARDPSQFHPVSLAIVADSDFADLVARLVLFAAWRIELCRQLSAAPDPALAAICAKSLPELRYHLEYAGLWLVRLGDGTSMSHQRMQAALDRMSPLLPDLFNVRQSLHRLPDISYDADQLRARVSAQVESLCRQATLTLRMPVGAVPAFYQDELTELVAEMQSVSRTLPGATW